MNSLLKSGRIPAVPHFDSFLFSMSTFEIMKAWFYHPHTLPRGYVCVSHHVYVNSNLAVPVLHYSVRVSCLSSARTCVCAKVWVLDHSYGKHGPCFDFGIKATVLG